MVTKKDLQAAAVAEVAPEAETDREGIVICLFVHFSDAFFLFFTEREAEADLATETTSAAMTVEMTDATPAGMTVAMIAEIGTEMTAEIATLAEMNAMTAAETETETGTDAMIATDGTTAEMTAGTETANATVALLDLMNNKVENLGNALHHHRAESPGSRKEDQKAGNNLLPLVLRCGNHHRTTTLNSLRSSTTFPAQQLYT